MRKNQLKYHDDTIARIVSSDDGGPIRRIINGRSRRPTGTFVSIKAGMKAMPWESHACELRAMQIAEVSTAVHRILAQPHRLELRVRSQKKPHLYFADLLLEVQEEVAAELTRGKALGAALMAGSVLCKRSHATRTVVIEMKSDNDRRMQDADYLKKLCLAKSVYQKLGIVFVVATETAAFRTVDLRVVREISLDRFTAVGAADVSRAVSCVETDGGVSSLGELTKALGGGHIGRAKAHALHVRRIISIDLRQHLGPASPVGLVRGPALQRVHSAASLAA
jgi:hypothetical protein